MSRESKLIVFVAVLASLLEIIDTSIVNVAIPTMMGSLGATLEDISMIITGYAIANAIVLPLAAWMGDRIGRRTYYLGCIVLFTATSVACGLAPNLATLTVFRIFQGFFGGALLPTSQALIYEQFPKEKAGTAGAIFGMSVMVGPTLGPTLGGYLTDNFGWRAIFNINLPLGILAVFIGYLVIKNPEVPPERAKETKKAPIDIWGLLLIAVGIGCLQFVLERGNSEDWFSAKKIVACSMIAAACLPTFIWWELRVKHPIINVRLFADGIVRNGVLLMAAVGFFLYTVVFLLPVFVGTLLRYDATQTGMLFIPGSLVTVFMMPVVGKMMGKRDPRLLIAIGLLAVELCLLYMTTFSPQTGRSQILNSLYIRGFGMAFLFIPINSSILSQFKGLELGQVSGLMNLSRQIGGSIGIALVATLLTVRSHQNYADLQSSVTVLSPAAQTQYTAIQNAMRGKMRSEIGTASPQQAAAKSFYRRAQAQVFMMSFNQLIWATFFIFSLAFIPLGLLRFKRKVTGPIDAH
jgi:DHA2 family multidrug resistance protein